MILFPNTRVYASVERPVTPGQIIDQEGKALIVTPLAGVFGVQKSAGVTATEQFAGVAYNMLNTVTSIPRLEDKTQGAGNTITLSKTPASGTLRIVDLNTSTVQTAGNPGTTANQYSISGNVVTLNAAQTGHVYRVAYSYVPTVVEATFLFGNVHPGGPSGLYLGQCGVITKGDVYTTEFDTTSDWAAGGRVYTGANGVFTLATSGTPLTNVSIIAAPQVGAPVAALGLEIR